MQGGTLTDLVRPHRIFQEMNWKFSFVGQALVVFVRYGTLCLLLKILGSCNYQALRYHDAHLSSFPLNSAGTLGTQRGNLVAS